MESEGGRRMPDRIAIAQVDRVRGLIGEVVVTVHADDPSRMSELGNVYLEGAAGGWEEITILGFKRLGERAVLRLSGYDTPEKAKSLVGRELFVDRETSTPAPAGRYYAYQLIGLEARLEDGTPVGLVEEVLGQPMQDLLVIRGRSGEFLVPFVPAICTQIDVQARTMVLNPPEGLLDLGDGRADD